MTLYSIETRQPIAFTKQSGNFPDVITISNAIKQLTALGVNTTEIVTDNGYYSEQKFSELLQAGFDFITLAKPSLNWIKPELDNLRKYRKRETIESIFEAEKQHATLPGIPCLICDFCSSDQRFAYTFLQIPPHDGHPWCSTVSFPLSGGFGTFTL